MKSIIFSLVFIFTATIGFSKNSSELVNNDLILNGNLDASCSKYVVVKDQNGSVLADFMVDLPEGSSDCGGVEFIILN
ncbi:hypothetical protein [uncultured Formosa sp.]|uniref:hypothetical protein n=1 Tax=uncultured Formosa sp. TaxID=255435 RepID=UPI0026211DCC|nr:hypothetical protein [uncultured Formosa sp.]